MVDRRRNRYQKRDAKRAYSGKTLVLRKEVFTTTILAGFLTYGNDVKAFSTNFLHQQEINQWP